MNKAIALLLFFCSFKGYSDELDKILAEPAKPEVIKVKKAELQESVDIITSIYNHLWEAIIINDERKKNSLKCMKQMKYNTAEVKKLYSRTQKLPLRPYSELYTVFGRVWSCLSCRKTALEECADAAIAIQKARNEAKRNSKNIN